MENTGYSTVALEHSIIASLEYNSEFEALAEYIDGVKYELDKPVKYGGEWFVAVADKYKSPLYLRKDLTVQEGVYTHYEYEQNSGYWETEDEALKAIMEYYKL